MLRFFFLVLIFFVVIYFLVYKFVNFGLDYVLFWSWCCVRCLEICGWLLVKSWELWGFIILSWKLEVLGLLVFIEKRWFVIYYKLKYGIFC